MLHTRCLEKATQGFARSFNVPLREVVGFDSSMAFPRPDAGERCADEQARSSVIYSTKQTYLFFKAHLLSHLFERLAIPLGLVSLVSPHEQGKGDIMPW